MPRDIYVLVGAEHRGPLSQEELARAVSTGQIAADAPVWSDGGRDWRPASTFLAPSAHTSTTLTGPPAVVVDGVRKSFGATVALANVSFTIPRGQILGLLGPNGAGKTTLFRLMMGILQASAGAITIDGKDAFVHRVALKRAIGFLPDEPIFYAYLSGRELLALSASMHGLDPLETLARLAPLIGRMGLEGDLGRFADEYSRGMKKKLGLLLALLHQPSLLILDEPTNGLDVASTRLFYDMALHLNS